MTNASSLTFTMRVCRARVLASVVTVAAVVAPAIASAAPVAGDTYVYRVSNGYNNEVRGKIQYRVDKVDADRIVVSVATDVPALGQARTEVYTKDGNWLRHPVINNGMLVEYEFSPAYPVFVLPLDNGKSWSVRVSATNTAAARRNSVRVDGEVLGTEHIITPAGAFDTIKVRRKVYAGDFDSFTGETTITETDWYALDLGRVVRSESDSYRYDLNRCSQGNSECTPIRGDWNVIELVETRTAKP